MRRGRTACRRELAHKNQSGGGKERREVLATRSSTRESALYVQELPEWRGRALGPPTPASWPSWQRVLPPAGHSYPRLPLSAPAFLSNLGPTLCPFRGLSQEPSQCFRSEHTNLAQSFRDRHPPSAPGGLPARPCPGLQLLSMPSSGALATGPLHWLLCPTIPLLIPPTSPCFFQLSMIQPSAVSFLLPAKYLPKGLSY